MARLSADMKQHVASEPLSDSELDHVYKMCQNMGGGRWERRILGNLEALQSDLAAARAQLAAVKQERDRLERERDHHVRLYTNQRTQLAAAEKLAEAEEDLIVKSDRYSRGVISVDEFDAAFVRTLNALRNFRAAQDSDTP